MNSVNLMKTSKDMPLDEMYSSTSNLSSTDDVDQIVEEKIEINTTDLMMGVNLEDGHHRHHNPHNLNQMITQSTQQCLNDVTNQQNGGDGSTTLSDSFKNRLHYVKYINRDGKNVKVWECGVCMYLFIHYLFYLLSRGVPCTHCTGGVHVKNVVVYTWGFKLGRGSY